MTAQTTDVFPPESWFREHTPAPPRTPVLTQVGRGVAAVARRVRWRAARTPVLAIGGFGFVDAAAWVIALPLGLAAIGVSLLVLEVLSGE